jgi:hypothetical protein
VFSNPVTHGIVIKSEVFLCAGACPANFGNFAVHTPNNFGDVFFVVADEFAYFGIGVVEVGVAI